MPDLSAHIDRLSDCALVLRANDLRVLTLCQFIHRTAMTKRQSLQARSLAYRGYLKANPDTGKYDLTRRAQSQLLMLERELAPTRHYGRVTSA